MFPDRCEVIEVIPSQRYVYPIFKNASSSLYQQANQSKWKIKINAQIQKLNNIEIVLRNPQQRLISGFNTFVQHTIRDHPDLDLTTVIWFAKNYLFLDRHYCPQFFWLINLSRYISVDALLTFISMNDIANITEYHKLPPGVDPVTSEIIEQVYSIPNIEMYQRIDQALFDQCLGRSMTFDEVVNIIQQHDSVAYDWVIGRSQRILNPTYVLSKT
jgi:hypothetical protein